MHHNSIVLWVQMRRGWQSVPLRHAGTKCQALSAGLQQERRRNGRQGGLIMTCGLNRVRDTSPSTDLSGVLLQPEKLQLHSIHCNPLRPGSFASAAATSSAARTTSAARYRRPPQTPARSPHLLQRLWLTPCAPSLQPGSGHPLCVSSR